MFLFAMGVPVFVSLGISSLIVLMLFTQVPLTIIPMMIFTGIEKFILIAIPLFILTGSLMSTGSLARRLINLCNSILGWTKGGLGAVNVLASLLFSGISGSSVADTATFGKLLVPMMESEGYSREYAVGITFTSSALSVIIPPSILMVLLGVVAELSVAKLLIGGIIPGLLIATAMLIINYIIARNRNYGSYTKFNVKNLLQNLKNGVAVLGAPIIILGSILGGIATPTEAAAIAVLYTIIIAGLFFKELNFNIVYYNFCQAAKLSSAIVLIIGSSTLFTWILSWENIPSIVMGFIFSITKNPYIILLAINIFLLFIGMLLDAGAAVVMLSPILFPLIKQLGISPIHFGVTMVVALSIGFVTPPFGVCLFTICSVTNISIEKAVKGSIPFLIVMFVSWFLITYIPELVLFLPNCLLTN